MADQHALSGLFPDGALKLAELSLCNWGSFHGVHHAAIHPDGTLVTGDNGAGKSTLVDGLTALLSPSGKAAFNIAAAQGDRTDRSLLSYVRGSYGATHDGARTQVLAKRSGATLTGLRATYRSEQGSHVSLCALFWITTASNALADLHRLYFVAHRDLALDELIEHYKRSQARGLKSRYRADDKVHVFESFSDYQAAYRQLLHLENANAPALLSRALGLKKIDDLTALIREFVLEPSNVRDAARTAVSEFADLVATHDQLVDARRQQHALADLPALATALDQQRQQLSTLEAEQAGLPVFLARQAASLWGQLAQVLQRRCDDIKRALQQLDHDLQDAQQAQEARHADYLQAGGERIETLKKDLQQAERELTTVGANARDYQRLARTLQQNDSLTLAAFQALQAQGQTAEASFQTRKTTAQDTFGKAAGALADAQQHAQALQTELDDVARRPDSNTPTRYQQLRDEMANSLNFGDGELMFVAELIDVRDDQTVWQGAIERALGGLRTTLAVPEARYPEVTAWLNQRHTGLHVRVQVVRAVKGNSQFREQGYLRKLEWRQHPYREWVKHLLSRHDLQCVADSQALDSQPFSLTRNGLIHREQGRFEKKDLRRIDDRRDWCLGFSNERRLASLRQQVADAETALQQHTATVTTQRRALNNVDAEINHWQALLKLSWDDIDLSRAQRQRDDIQTALQRLTAAGGDLATAKTAWEHTKQQCQQLKKQTDEQIATLGGQQAEQQRAEQQQQHCQQRAATSLGDDVIQRLQERLPTLHSSQLQELDQIEARHRDKLNSALAGLRGRINSNENRAVGLMSSYRSQDEWQTITAEWGSAVRDLPTYLERLQYIEKEGLPELVEQFRDRLNRHTTHSLAGIRQRIDNELDDIRDRIDTINQVLARTEFKAGTHLQIKLQREEFPHLKDFNQRLSTLLGAVSQDTEQDHEARFNGLQQVIEILDKATSTASAHTLESKRLLDPRYQLGFKAEDTHTQSGQVLDVLDSSSGKSGGEKEAFAGTIVAASLAYVLTPDGADQPIYSTVFLDEAFSNTAEAVSRRVLRVFRALHLHVNLITPYKNLNLARESARSLLIAERDAEHHESRLSQVTWEEIDARLAKRAQRQQATLDKIELAST